MRGGRFDVNLATNPFDDSSASPSLAWDAQSVCVDPAARGTRLPKALLTWQAALCRFVASFGEMTMGSSRLKIFAIAAALAAGTSGAAMAQTACAPGYAFYNGACQPIPAAGYPSGPLSGAAAGGAAGAANGSAAAGPVGAIVGGAVGTATGAVTGTANALTGAMSPPAPPAPMAMAAAAPLPNCGAGRVLYMGACYPDLTGAYTLHGAWWNPGS